MSESPTCKSSREAKPTLCQRAMKLQPCSVIALVPSQGWLSLMTASFKCCHKSFTSCEVTVLENMLHNLLILLPYFLLLSQVLPKHCTRIFHEVKEHFDELPFSSPSATIFCFLHVFSFVYHFLLSAAFNWTDTGSVVRRTIYSKCKQAIELWCQDEPVPTATRYTFYPFLCTSNDSLIAEFSISF